MQISYSLNQEQHVKLFMTSELKQSIQILQLSGLEMDSYLQERAMDNPFIEIENMQRSYFSGSKRLYQSTHELPDLLGNVSVKVETLENYVINQLRMTDYTAEQFKAISFFAGNLDEAGYLAIGLEEACDALRLPLEVVEDSLTKLQSFDPPGIGGRNLYECLSIQIQNDPNAVPGSLEVVIDHLHDLGKGKYDKISKILDINESQVSKILEYIRTLNPRPGLAFGRGEQQHITIEAKVRIDQGKFVIEMIQNTFSKVTISKEYIELLKDIRNKEVSHYLKDKLKKAEWLLSSLDYRNNTLFKVIYAIVETQSAFLECGVDGLKPLNLKDLSIKLGLHESTVSRAIKNKFMDTPRGIFELKYFFSNGITTAEGEEVSSKIVKSSIKNMIEEEDKNKPLSDQKIANMLLNKGFRISRRTVAKYREEERILSSAMRRS